MSSNSSYDLPSKRGIPWPFVLKVTAWALPFVLIAVLTYAKTQFATHEEFSVLTKEVATQTTEVNAKLGSLNEWRSRAEVQQTELSSALQTIAKEQAGQRALLDAIRQNQDRTITRLDIIADRQTTTKKD